MSYTALHLCFASVREEAAHLRCCEGSLHARWCELHAVLPILVLVHTLVAWQLKADLHLDLVATRRAGPMHSLWGASFVCSQV